MEITPGAYVEGRPLYHVRMNLSIGKLMKFSISSKCTKKFPLKIEGKFSSNCTNWNGVGLFYNDFDLFGRFSEQKSVIADIFTETHFFKPGFGLVFNSQRIVFG